MQLINKTNWRTEGLKKVLTQALNEDDKVEGKYKYRNKLKVEIVYSKGYPKWVIEHYKKNHQEAPQKHHYSGYAYYNGSEMRLRIPRQEINNESLVRLFTHEMSHIRGYRHKQMGGYGIGVDTKWAKDNKYQIRQKEVIVKLKEVAELKETVVKPKQDLQLKRYEHIRIMVEQKKSQLKRLQNQIKKWAQKERYYQKILTANGKIKEE